MYLNMIPHLWRGAFAFLCIPVQTLHQYVNNLDMFGSKVAVGDSPYKILEDKLVIQEPCDDYFVSNFNPGSAYN